MKQVEAIVQSLDFNMMAIEGQPTLPSFVIAGLVMPGAATITHRSLTKQMPTKNMEIALATDEQVERLATFFTRFFVETPTQKKYDCHSFMGFLQGWDDDIDIHRMSYRGYELDEQPSTDLKVGMPYAASSPSGIKHGLVGLGGDQCLSVLGAGIDSPLVISEGSVTVAAYRAVSAHAVLSYHDFSG